MVKWKKERLCVKKGVDVESHQPAHHPKSGYVQAREFGQLIDDQKEKVINQLHARWTDPESEIVRRMNSFSEKKPRHVKTDPGKSINGTNLQKY